MFVLQRNKELLEIPQAYSANVEKIHLLKDELVIVSQKPNLLSRVKVMLCLGLSVVGMQKLILNSAKISRKSR